MFSNINSYNSKDENELFFNQGRSAIKFILKILTAYYKRSLTVALQAFNCETVVKAVLEAKCQVILMDVKITDFSIDFNELTIIDRPDILILTHYQGVPNIQYEIIAEYCTKNNIFLIEDLCQTEYSKINGVLVGELANVSIRSFGFDKPFCCYQGGSLYINNVQHELKEQIKTKYAMLPIESDASAILDLEVLQYLLELHSEKNYKSSLDCLELIRKLMRLKIKEEIIPEIVTNTIVQRLFRAKTKISELVKGSKIQILRLNPLKQDFILVQRQYFDWERNNMFVEFLEEWLSSRGYPLHRIDNAVINWNRYSIYDQTDKMKQEMALLNIEAGNFNWAVPMNQLFKRNKNIVIQESYINSEHLCKHIVNIPVWCDLSKLLNT
jgi:dTDP-4-amino-4,6-dideoxygalactose transaminase